MEEIPLPPQTTPDQINLFKRIFGSAQGIILDLSADSGAELQPGQIGVFNTSVFIYSIEGTKIKLTGVSW